MCGIAGFLFSPRSRISEPDRVLQRMTSAMANRGPDDVGHWIDHEAGIALGHRRLSVVDLSAAGHQPMLSESGRYALIYNGEIYNHLEIRDEIERVFPNARSFVRPGFDVPDDVARLLASEHSS